MQNLSESVKRNIALNFYKDKGLVLQDNNEVYFQGGLAGWHNGISIVAGKLEVLFVPSGKMKEETYKKKFGAES